MSYTLTTLILVLSWLTNSGLSSIIEIDEKNFQHVEREEQVILYFYGPNCSKCDLFYEDTIDTIVNHTRNTNLIFARINITKHATLTFMFQVRDVPTLIALRSQNIFFYKYQYNSADFSKFTKEIFIDPVPQINSELELERVLSSSVPFAVGYFSNQNSASAEAFKTACLLIGYINCTMARTTQMRPVSFPWNIRHIELVTHNENRTTIFQFKGNLTSSTEIKEFIQNNELPLIVEYDESVSERLADHPVKLNLMVFVNKSSSDFPQHLREIETTSRILRGKAITILVDTQTSSDVNQMLGIIDLKISDVPTFTFLRIDYFQELKYVSNSHRITSKEMVNFYKKVQNKSVRPYFKSEKLSPNWNKTLVHQLVKENFKEVTEKKNLTVLVMFYSTTCGHSPDAFKLLEYAAHFYSNRSDIVLAQINSDLNDIEDFPIYSTPSIFLYTKADKRGPKLFEEERTLENLIKFVEEFEPSFGQTTEPNKIKASLSEEEGEL